MGNRIKNEMQRLSILAITLSLASALDIDKGGKKKGKGIGCPPNIAAGFDQSDISGLFATCDLDGDACLSKKELLDCNRTQCGKLWEKQVRSFYNCFDENEDDCLEESEFEALVTHAGTPEPADPDSTACAAAFAAALDPEGDENLLGGGEIREWATDNYEPWAEATEKEIKKGTRMLVRECDENGDKKLDWDEWETCACEELEIATVEVADPDPAGTD